MALLSWILLGLVAGALARIIMPGRDGGGILFTMGLGIAGALLGGFLATFVGFGGVSGLNLGSIILSMAGALLLLFLYRRFRG